MTCRVGAHLVRACRSQGYGRRSAPRCGRRARTPRRMSCSTSIIGKRPFRRAKHCRPAARSRRARCRPSARRAAAASAPSRARWRARAPASRRATVRPPAISARSASPTCASAARAGAFSSSSSAARPKKRKLEPLRACTASATFSSTEKPGRIEVIWNERASPRVARACTGRLRHVLAAEKDLALRRARASRRSG